MRTGKSTSIALFVLTTLLLASGVQAFVTTNDPSLPVLYPTGEYRTPQNVHATFHGPGLTVVLDMIEHRAFGPVNQAFIGPDEREDFSSTLVGQISVNGSPNQPTNANGPVSTEVFGKNGNVTGTFNTEMLAMNLAGTSPFGPYMIRESPTLASTGQTAIADIGGGLFHIDSFFDVFTELSVDGGNSWIPSDSSSHVNLEPEPATLVLLLIGAIGLRRRRSNPQRFR